jgi:TolB protein
MPVALMTNTPQPTSTPSPTFTATPTGTPTPRYPSDLAGRIVFARKSVPWSNDTSEICVLDLSTDTVTQLTHNNAVDWYPDWSPDGAHIVFTTNRNDNYDIWVMSADGSEQKAWITLNAWDDYARYSPDGAQIAFATTGTTNGAPNSEIYVGSSNTRLRRVTFNKGADEWPSWSPDGRWLADSSNRDGYMAVFVFAVGDTNIKNWTADTTFSEQPAWSPEGEWIAFVRKAQTAPGQAVDFGDVWIGKRDRSEFRQLTQDGCATHPAWSPDGRYIVYSHHWDSTGDGQVTTEDASELWAMAVDGGQPFVLTQGKSQDFAPRWSQ